MKLTLSTLKHVLKWLVASTLVLTITSSVFGQFYILGGASYWPSLEAPNTTLYGLPLADGDEDGVDRLTDLWIGAGYRVNETWSFEAFFSKLPSTQADIDLFSIFGGQWIVAQSVSLSITTDTNVLGFGAVYEFPINDQLSLIGKAGVARTQQSTEVDLSLPSFPFPPIFFGDDDDSFDVDDYYDEYFDDDIYDDLLEEDETTFDMYFAFGIKLPIQNTRASVSATYQFISTPQESESGLFVGICWDI